MSAATQYYMITLLVYVCANVIAAWGLDLQFGVTGVLNFAFIIFQAVGAYTAGVLSLGPSSASQGFETYVGGARLPFPLPIIGAMLAGAALAAIVGLIALRRLRSDYQAMVMLVVSVVATTVVTSETGLVNGAAGLSLIGNPMGGIAGIGRQTQQWVFVAFCGAVVLAVGALMYAVVYSPHGRVLRAVRENEHAVEALGPSATRCRLEVFILGGARRA